MGSLLFQKQIYYAKQWIEIQRFIHTLQLISWMLPNLDNSNIVTRKFIHQCYYFAEFWVSDVAQMSITRFENILVVLPCVIQSTAIELYAQKESNVNQVRPYFEQSCFGFLFKTVLEDFVTSPGCLQGVSMNFQGF